MQWRADSSARLQQITDGVLGQAVLVRLQRKLTEIRPDRVAGVQIFVKILCWKVFIFFFFSILIPILVKITQQHWTFVAQM